MDVQTLEFDSPHYQVINEAREDWLRRVFKQLPFRDQLRTALDAGCGAGHFSGVLNDLGLNVWGVDLQPENIAVCRSRYPHLTFDVADLDGEFQLEKKDVALLFGILYHLQSPLTTVQRLCQSIGRIGIVSTRVAAGEHMAMYLFQENRGAAHNLAAVTAVPTFPALITMFALGGMEFVYLPDEQPIHPEWRGSTQTNGKRYSFVVAREPMYVKGWKRIEAKNAMKKWESAAIRSNIVSRMAMRLRCWL